ncbi:TonB family protein [Beijerinckia indica]|uniref:TonB family protein n=1 Tax=Beijerinckia indica subsp. indica (strain ATCC 9039 / DSM 1715 / NCIMB 8712) TaxID=395963 RepID=B2IKE3_BEII9|nr:TonB family protein [Beijerinckia indica]ACB96423.1 TonB family protein [Beijerinckia indica subsp. indica ATCC 9039]
MRDSLLPFAKLRADPSARLDVGETKLRPLERWRFGALLWLFFFLHFGVIIYLLWHLEPETPTAQEEIPVEVVMAPPPEPAAPAPPPLIPDPPKEKPKPEQLTEQKPIKIEKDNAQVAFDAPRTPNQETNEKKSPDKKSGAPNKAEPASQAAPKPAQLKEARLAPEALPKEEEKAESELKPDDRPDAEALDKASPQKSLKKQSHQTPTRTKMPLSEDAKAAVARQLSSLTAAPSFSVAQAARPSPISGGTADSSYLSILFGLITRQQQDPHKDKPRHMDAEVVVGFWIDETGRLTHQALYRTSGQPDLDAAAMAAVRKAAPFPEPPRGIPRGFVARLTFPAR